MSTLNQPDLFGSVSAPDAPASYAPSRERVRAELSGLLRQAREGVPAARARFIRTVVPQMTRWLPEDEADAVRRDFDAALSRVA